GRRHPPSGPSGPRPHAGGRGTARTPRPAWPAEPHRPPVTFHRHSRHGGDEITNTKPASGPSRKPTPSCRRFPPPLLAAPCPRGKEPQGLPTKPAGECHT